MERMPKVVQSRLQWSWTGEPEFLVVVDREIRAWAGTRYMSGQQVRGEHADCIRYGCGIWDGLYGWRRELPRNLALDAATHSPEAAREQLRLLLSVYPHACQVLPIHGVYHVEPGDFVVTGFRKGGEGHLVVVGAEPNTCWEAPHKHSAVRKIGIGLHACLDIKHVYRASDRMRWLRMAPAAAAAPSTAPVAALIEGNV